MKPLASLLIVAVIILGVSSTCHPSWTFFQGDCYRYGDKAVSWSDAQIICQARGAKLAEVPSLQENNFVTSVAREKRADCMWLGGNDFFHEGVMEWESTSDTINGFTNWFTGEPSGGDGQDCLSLHLRFNYAWNDNVCTSVCNFICSRPSIDNVG